MEYLGKKSVSSFIGKLLNILWYVGIPLSVVGIIFVSCLIYFPNLIDLGNTKIKINFLFMNFNYDGTESMKLVPIFVKIVLVPFLIINVFIMFMIIDNLRMIFKKLATNSVFIVENVKRIRTAAKLCITLSILGLDLSALFVSLVLFVIGEILKMGTNLQDEQNLTV